MNKPHIFCLGGLWWVEYRGTSVKWRRRKHAYEDALCCWKLENEAYG
jgi:hypothetical protein